METIIDNWYLYYEGDKLILKAYIAPFNMVMEPELIDFKKGIVIAKKTGGNLNKAMRTYKLGRMKK